MFIGYQAYERILKVLVGEDAQPWQGTTALGTKTLKSNAANTALRWAGGGLKLAMQQTFL